MDAVSRYAFAACTFTLILAAGLGNSAVRSAELQQHPHHDIYSGFFENGRYRNEGGIGLPCCGDDPINGDCEPVGSAFSILPNGDVVFTSQRYQTKVLVARDKVLWISLRGGEFSEAHWCGRPRPDGVLSSPIKLNPDPWFWTLCAMISPRDM